MPSHNGQLRQGFDVLQRVPQAADVTSMPRKDRRDLKAMAKWFHDQFTKGMTLRRRIARNWISVRSIMEGYHYYKINAFGVWSIIPKKPGEIRAVTGLMYANYRRELGRLVDNIISVSVVPRSARNGMAFYKADRGQVMLNAWSDEIDIEQVWDEFSQHHLFWGMSALYRWADKENQQYRVEAVPAPELLPIPYYVTSDVHMDGIIRAKVVSRQWVEDNVPEASGKLAKQSGGMSESTLYITEDLGQWGKEQDAALAIWIWMKPSKGLPQGFRGLMIEDEIFRYEPSKDIPFEISRYDKHPTRWYGVGFCEKQVAPQKEENRQLTDIIKSARFNKGRLFVDTETFDLNDLKNSDQQVIQTSDAAYTGNRDPFKYFAPASVGKDVAAVMQIAEMDANRAAGHESGILRGQAEGRTDSGPAISILNTNAKAPLVPALSRMYRALSRTFPHVLDGISELWPIDKKVTVIGPQDMPQEITLGKDNRPSASEVIIRPGPIMPMGRSEMVNLLMNWRQMRADDGKPLLTVAEFKRAMRHAGMIPPGVDSVDVVEQRILQKLDELFNDGQQPGIDISDRNFHALEKYEDHRRSIELIKSRMLQPAFRDPQITSIEVQQAFAALLDFHINYEMGDPGAADDIGLELEKIDALQQEQNLDIGAQDRFSNEGVMSLDGIPIGLN